MTTVFLPLSFKADAGMSGIVIVLGRVVTAGDLLRGVSGSNTVGISGAGRESCAAMF